jgi:hypothetical protein
MLLFRSEEHIDRWCRQWRRDRGATLTLDQQWRLARAWFSADRRDAQWRRRTVEEAESLFRDLRLEGDFWFLR